ncbi:P-type DNA transfer protein VirB5 [Variovorax sp. J22R133]|uniref:P-type DNA transfer protein VirB5 n=1 Tax=Variovorax brevis TaxID=3053503 RepID=UPI002578CF3A|nr:P-type DNA transfer protein VirB5 [Variovorax sp. J22R133]MDM0116770.1 P-type DNA transfer protein VirB5 [Variovorax sp. J22R133]
MKLTQTMTRSEFHFGVSVAAGLIGVACGAHAQVPVTVTSDIPATMNQIQTIAKWAEQLNAMSRQLDQMRQVYGTLQGSRNLGNLMNNDLLTQYLPQDYVQAAQRLRSGSGSFSGISGSLNDIVRANQLKSCAELNSDAAMRSACTQQWRQLALQKQIGDMGYRKASENIRNLQTFVGSINASTDQKAISEVQARIQVETVRMQNEQIKLSTIQAMEEADRRLQQQSAIDNFNAGMARGSAGGIRF